MEAAAAASATPAPTLPASNQHTTRPAKKKTSGASVLIGFVIAIVIFTVVVSNRSEKSSGDASENTPTVAPQAASTDDQRQEAAAVASAADAAAQAAGADANVDADKKTEASNAQAIDISAADLFLEYKANEVLADSKYKGKLLAVNGVVQSINKDFTGDPYVNLVTANQYESVRGNFSKSAIDTLAKLHQGDHVTLTCLGRGMVIGSPMLDCTR